jgi:tRNA uridine 5-carbamoylmethylation protein Kti12
MSQNNNLQDPILIIIRGLPGSGKSFIADKLSSMKLKELVSVIDPDRIDFDTGEYKNFSVNLAKENVDPIFYPYRFLRNIAYETIDSCGLVIWTQAFTNLEMLDKTIKNLESYANHNNLKLRVLVVEVDIDENTARNRTKEREKLGEHGVSDENFKRFVKDYTSFGGNDYRKLTVDGNDNVEMTVEKIIREISNI